MIYLYKVFLEKIYFQLDLKELSNHEFHCLKQDKSRVVVNHQNWKKFSLNKAENVMDALRIR
jgi:hypothetical protein